MTPTNYKSNCANQYSVQKPAKVKKNENKQNSKLISCDLIGQFKASYPKNT